MESICLNDINPAVLSVCVRKFQKQKTRETKKFTYTYRIIYVTEGTLRLRTESGDLCCNEGGLIFLPPGISYCTEFKSETVRLYHLFFDLYNPRGEAEAAVFPPGGVFMTGLADIKLSAHPEVSDATFLNSPTVVTSIKHASERFERILHEYTDNRPYCRLRTGAMLTELLVDAARAQESTGKAGHSQNPAVKPIIDYIKQNYTGKITCQGIAGVFHYHPNYVTYLIRQATGMTVRGFITSLRVAEASRLLDETNMSVTDIAQSLGFYDSSHFCNVYYHTTGCTPRGSRHYSV